MRRLPVALLSGVALLGALATPATALEAGVVSRARFPNGLTLLVRENPTAPVVAVSLAVRMGTRWETRETAGISNFLQLMVVRGTTSRSGTQIVEDADRLGGKIDAIGDQDWSQIEATALSRHRVALLELVADVALRPSIPDGLVEPIKQFLLRQIRNRAEQPYPVAFDTLMHSLFGLHPYAWHPLGSRESVERIDRPALLAHYRRHYVPSGMVLAVSGRVRAPAVIAEVERLFGAMPAGQSPPASKVSPPAAAVSREVREVPGAQAQILIGALAPPLTHPDYPAVKVLSTVLGGGMAGRFFTELRDKQALAYSTGALYPSLAGTGYVVTQLGTAPENLRRAEPSLKKELDRIREEPPSAEELRVAKAYLLGHFAMDRRTNARQAWYLATFELAGVGHEFLDRYVAAVRDVTPADVQRVARTYLGTVRESVARPPAR
ncbi:MAG: insulinase family protein [Candidatus Rokubacteria bacterium]|nr:insulinase family protein [Candidatus Rokubacteria bacterium]